MRYVRAICFIVLLVIPLIGAAQATLPRSILGTINVIQSPATEFEVKPDNGSAVSVKVTSATVVQRVAPGETDLKKATTIPISEVAKGDRVLVTLTPNTSDVLRILVMSAMDIAKRD